MKRKAIRVEMDAARPYDPYEVALENLARAFGRVWEENAALAEENERLVAEVADLRLEVEHLRRTQGAGDLI